MLNFDIIILKKKIYNGLQIGGTGPYLFFLRGRHSIKDPRKFLILFPEDKKNLL